MKLAHYGLMPFCPWTNHFFTEQVSHLEIAVKEYEELKALKIQIVNRPVLEFKDSAAGKIHKIMKSGKWMFAIDIAEKAKTSRKGINGQFQVLRRQGYKINRRWNVDCKKPEYQLEL